LVFKVSVPGLVKLISDFYLYHVEHEYFQLPLTSSLRYAREYKM